MSASSNNFVLQDPATAADDSDADSDSAGHDAYYLPISAYDDPGSDGSDDCRELETPSSVLSNGAGAGANHHDPGFLHFNEENDVSGVNSNGFKAEGGDDEDSDDEEEIERDASISRAFRADESRRSAPLAPEAAARIMDAMRGVSLQGIPPAWADQVPEDRWVDQLRRLRGESDSHS